MKAIMFKASEIDIKKFWINKKLEGIEFQEDFINLLRRVNINEDNK